MKRMKKAFGSPIFYLMVWSFSLLAIFSCLKCTRKIPELEIPPDAIVEVHQPERPATIVNDLKPQLKIPESNEGFTMTFEPVLFPFDDYDLQDTAIQYLSKISRQMENASVQLDGHASEEGSAEYNMALSERRAQAVAQYLQNAGISGVNVTAWGEERPTGQGLAFDRRSRRSFQTVGKA